MLKFSEMTPEQRTAYETYYRDVLLTGKAGFKVLDASAIFNEHGLRFPLDYLKEISVNVILLPIEIIATYADAITVDKINSIDISFLTGVAREIMQVPAREVLERGNATTIGNLAYVVLYCPSTDLCEAVEAYMNEIFEHVRLRLEGFAKGLPQA